MTDPAIGPAQAAEALNQVETAGRRARALVFSANMSAPLMTWGLVWLVCNLACQFAPSWGPILWAPGTVIGVAVSVMAKRRGATRDLRPFGVMLALVAFVSALAAAFHLGGADQQNLLISLLVALGYVTMGLYRSRWIALIGTGLFVIALLGWFLDHTWFFAWMGVAGGGCLFVTGLWSRRL